MTKSDLAAGARSAAFQVEGQDELVHDLKILTAAQFVEKYDATEEDYEHLVDLLQRNPSHLDFDAPDLRKAPAKKVATIPLAEQGVKVKVTIPEKVRYAGEALGDEVLVVRTEREHSSQLIIPESAKAKSDIGFIVAHGMEASRARHCGVGALVLFDRFAAHGKEIELVDEQGVPRQHLLLNDCDIQLKLKRQVAPSES